MMERLLVSHLFSFLMLVNFSICSAAPFDLDQKITDIFGFVENRDGKVEYLSLVEKKQREKLALYRGFYTEGKNLQQECKKSRPVKYSERWQRSQVVRSVYANMQMLLLEKTMEVIPAYSKVLEFSNEEYNSFVKNLVGNYCSQNITVMSKKIIEKRLQNSYSNLSIEEAQKRIPQISENKYFPKKKLEFTKDQQNNELDSIVKMFISACSWNGDFNSPMLLSPFINHPALMAYLIGHMTGQEIRFDANLDDIYIRAKTRLQDQSGPVFCDQLICRASSDALTLEGRLPKSEGGQFLAQDLRALYCFEWKDKELPLGEQSKDIDLRLQEIAKNLDFLEQNSLTTQLISLITGVPHFYGRAIAHGVDIKEIHRSNLLHVFEEWANLSLGADAKRLLYEEPLSLELIDRKHYQDFSEKKFKLAFDLNVGEFDRDLISRGKLKVDFKLSIKNSFLQYYREFLRQKDLTDVSLNEVARMKNRLKIQLEGGLEQIKKKFYQTPWKGDLALLMADELSEQIAQAPSAFFDFESSKSTETQIEISFYYGIFALKYFSDIYGPATPRSF